MRTCEWHNPFYTRFSETRLENIAFGGSTACCHAGCGLRWANRLAKCVPGHFLAARFDASDTAVVRGLAGGLGARPEDVSSPTFTLIQEYRGRLTLYHVDLYRLEPAEVDDLGLDELVVGDGVVAVEWAERWKGRPEGAGVYEVTIEDEGEDSRKVIIALPTLPKLP